MEKGGSGLGVLPRLAPSGQAAPRQPQLPPCQGFPPTLRCFPGCRQHLLTQLPHCTGPSSEQGEIQAGGRGQSGAARLAAESGRNSLQQKLKSPISSPPLPTAPLLYPIPTGVPKGFLLLPIPVFPAPCSSTSPICITSRQRRQECKQAPDSIALRTSAPSLLHDGDAAPALGSALWHPQYPSPSCVGHPYLSFGCHGFPSWKSPEGEQGGAAGGNRKADVSKVPLLCRLGSLREALLPPCLKC